MDVYREPKDLYAECRGVPCEILGLREGDLMTVVAIAASGARATVLYELGRKEATGDAPAERGLIPVAVVLGWDQFKRLAAAARAPGPADQG